MSHHYSGPDFSFPQGDARLDFTDLYAFPKPGDPGKSILIMNVHPSAGESPPGPTTTEPFAPEALYELKIDTDGDGVADIAYRVRFSAFERGVQTARLYRVDGPQAAGTADGGRVIVDGAPVSIGREARVTEAGDIRFFAGWRSDPFFCDVAGAKNNFQFTGDDFFADKDVCSIVLEVPNSALGAKEVRLWARTLMSGAGGGWFQVERGARPAQAVVLVEERDAYLGGEPADDERFLAGFAHALEHMGGYTPAEAKRVAGTLLPDVLPYDATRPASFPDNGRTLTDDAFDWFVRVLTNEGITGNHVGPHGDLLLEFPYVGPPHQSRVTKPNEKETTNMKDQTQIRVTKRSPEYWRVTIDHPPLNIFGPEMLPQVNDVITALETDEQVKVVVFDSAVEGFFLIHLDFLANLDDLARLSPGPTGLHPWPEMLVRLSRASVVSIASIRGRATGMGSELGLACDMRFASREKAILSQFEVGAGLVPGGGPMARLSRLMGRGRALEVMLSANDISGDLAELYGYVNRSLPDAELNGFVDALATRIASFDKQTIADIKRLVNVSSLAPDIEIESGWNACMASMARPATQKRIKELIGLGFCQPGDAENRLGDFVGQYGR
jgi:enoyl-CoA hydratase/carnithine racemase